MKERLIDYRLVIVSLFLVLISFVICGAKKKIVTPETKVEIVVDTLHGNLIEDPYQWLEDQESPDTRAWIDSQNKYTKAILETIPQREKLRKRFSELIKTDYISRPSQRNGRYFLYKKAADQEQYIIYIRKGLDGEDVVLVDPHNLSEDLTKSVGIWDLSDDGTVMVYGIRDGGEDQVALKIMNVDTREEYPDSMPRANYFGFSLMSDMSGYYYSLRNDSGSRVYYHKMGTDLNQDIEIFGEDYGPEYIVSCGISEDGNYLLLYAYEGSSGEKTEIYYKDLKEDGEIKILVNDINAISKVNMVSDKMFIKTNWKAPNWRIMTGDIKNPSPQNWRELIPEGEGVIRGFSTVGGKLFVNYMKNVMSRVKIYQPDGKHIGEISFPAIGTVGGVSGRWDSDIAFFSYYSYHIPTIIYQYDVSSDIREIWSQLDVPVDWDKFEVKQVWYKSTDGTKIPMFLVHNKDIKLDGSNPVLLTSYGGFRSSMTPYYSSRAVCWVENGGVYAVPALRGGGEFGEEWHRAAMFEKKQNTFDDFIAGAEWLIENGYTKPSKLAIRGGSNGGLLVGAAMTQRPDLFQAVVCTYPLLDMVRYHKFLMGPYWISEYGSADNPDQFDYIYAYSPYHNVKAGTEYPAVMFITGDADTRVAPLHARKMTALMQAATASKKPVILHYETKAGHMGGTPMSKRIENITDEQCFLFWQLGIE
jgi:prolyl oligopeptidase